jgi:excisionase family DNA binding protein
MQNKSNENAERLAYSVKDIMAQTGLSRGTIDKEIRAGKLPHKRIGRKIIVTAEALQQWLEASDAWEPYRG